MTGDYLTSWRDGVAKEAVHGFVARVTDPATSDFLPAEDRVAVFDNDGTLWCEKPMPIQLDFILRRFLVQAEEDPELRDRQPWKAAYTHDYGWLGDAMTKHYTGDDSDLKLLLDAHQQAFGGMSVDEYARQVHEFLDTAAHPTMKRSYRDCVFLPMVELLRFLESHGFATYIASGGDRDFMRPAAGPLYGIPPDRVIGSSFGLRYVEDARGGAVMYKASVDFFDDGPEKPVRIWSRIGRRPVLAGGNANGDVPMLHFAGGPARPALRLLVLHDDADREFAYVAGAEQALDRARDQGWTVVSMKDDWDTVFG
ncbi:HAD family hydrolase [Kribbella sp. CA-247076]|uniref:HAD family hydrolase n=1 Tax=Kribbella sp. CA-247076 TaxID=3239941 RepID=UPI003D929B7F